MVEQNKPLSKHSNPSTILRKFLYIHVDTSLTVANEAREVARDSCVEQNNHFILHSEFTQCLIHSDKK
jgi:hypothetical protein